MYQWGKLRDQSLADGECTLAVIYWQVTEFLCRGLAGTCLVYKIAGALAQRGGSLDEVEDIAKIIASNLVTIGVGLDHCHVRDFEIISTDVRSNVSCQVPGTANNIAHLKVNECEIGMGVCYMILKLFIVNLRNCTDS